MPKPSSQSLGNKQRGKNEDFVVMALEPHSSVVSMMVV